MTNAQAVETGHDQVDPVAARTTPFDGIVDTYVDRFAALDPCLAAMMGIAGHENALTDYGPDGAAAREDLARRTLALVDGTDHRGADGVAVAMLRERLSTDVALAEADAYATLLDTLDGPVQRIRHAVALLDQGADADWVALHDRLRAIPAAVAGLRDGLASAHQRGLVAPLRQVTRNARECQDVGRYLLALPGRCGDDRLRHHVETAARSAAAAFTSLASHLARELASDAPTSDAVGRERYQLGVRDFLGTELDLEHTYAWGWDELARVDREMVTAAAQITPDDPVSAVLTGLDDHDGHRMAGVEAFRDWIQELADTAIADLGGTHFVIPEPLRRIDCRITRADGVATYSAPSEDASRPGTIWWPLSASATTFPTWTVPSVMFHEAVPGHHLQLGVTTLSSRTLNRFQRLSSELHPGHCEGWALYAERLMDELGYLADPAHRLGMLYGQRFRAARVVVDIGMHLQLPVPAGAGAFTGRRWTPDLGREFLTERCDLRPAGLVDFEIDRYLGRPGQALAYKVGERVWLEARQEARRREGAAFDLARFHQGALALGPMGLDLLRDELAAVSNPL